MINKNIRKRYKSKNKGEEKLLIKGKKLINKNS